MVEKCSGRFFLPILVAGVVAKWQQKDYLSQAGYHLSSVKTILSQNGCLL